MSFTRSDLYPGTETGGDAPVPPRRVRPRVPKFAFPFQRDASGKVAVVEQGSPDHVLACENVVARCPLGWRTDRPEFGWPFPMFRNGPLDIDFDALTDALRTFGPRRDVSGEEYADVADAAVRHMTVDIGVSSDGD